jgi:hypothetical protein
MNLKVGDLVFTTDRKPWSRIIRRITKSDISHVGILIKVRDNLVIAEMLSKGLTLTPLYMKTDIQKIGRLTSMTKHYAYCISDQVVDDWSNGGIEYDWSGVLGFISSRIKHKKDKFFCSEYVSYLLRTHVSGLSFPELDHEIDPSDLIDHLGDELLLFDWE